VFSGVPGPVLLFFSMLPDVMHAGHDRSGVRQEGVLAGLFTASEKVGMAVGPLVAGTILAAASLVPAILFLVSLLPLRHYEHDA